MAKFKSYVRYVYDALATVYVNLTPSQRRKVYAVAIAAGVALAAKVGIDATTAADWLTFGVSFVVGVLIPAFAGSKVSDE